MPLSTPATRFQPGWFQKGFQPQANVKPWAVPLSLLPLLTPAPFTFLPFGEQLPGQHGGNAGDVVPALEPLAVERHDQGEGLGADLFHLDARAGNAMAISPTSPLWPH